MESTPRPDKFELVTQRPRADEQFCQRPSKGYLAKLDEAGGDPRSVSGTEALVGLQKSGGWVPDIDARDNRT